MRGRQVFSDGGEVAKKALVGQEETGAKAMVKAEGMLQTVVGHQERLSLVNKDNTQRNQRKTQTLSIGPKNHRLY